MGGSQSPINMDANARPAQVVGRSAPVSLEDHPAVVAWGRLRPRRLLPDAIDRLQKKKKACVYRLRGVGPGGTDVIGKMSTAERIARERAIYERVLPSLPVSGVQYYGSVDEPDGVGCWVFVEDAGGEPYSPRCDRHRALAGRWLAQLHVSATERFRLANDLPDRHPAYYLAQLRNARETLTSHLSNPVLAADDVALIRDVARQCATTEAHWPAVHEWTQALPATFIHADFAPKNMRVRTGRTGDVLLPYDWGSAGYGSVAADLAQAGTASGDCWDYWANVDLDAYLDGVREAWPGVTGEDVRRVALVGKLFRCLVCIRLEAPSFAFEYVEHAVRDMRVYRAAMADALGALGWND
jgi:hypothetical protein